MNRNILFSIALTALFAGTSCNMDRYPYDSVSSGSMSNPENAETATNGNYALFKAALDNSQYTGFFTVGNTWIRHYYLMSELKSDNVLMSGKSTDPLFMDATLDDTASDINIDYFWFISYKIAYSTSVVIDNIPDDTEDAKLKHIKGENYFLRALAHLGLCNIFAKPYAFGRDNPGVILRTGAAGSGKETRATVGQVYDQIEADLKNAVNLMGETGRGNNGYADKMAAMGLLSRVYLHEGKDMECVNIVNEMLAGADPASKLDPDIVSMFRNTKESQEVLWCVGLMNNPNDYPGAQAMLGSMYFSLGDPGNGTGWAEIYYSQPLLNLFNRYPDDKRLTQMCVRRNLSETGAKMIYWAVPSAEGFYENHIDRNPVYDAVSGKYICQDATGKKHSVETETVNTYPQTWIDLDGEKQYVTVADSMGCRTGTGGDMFPLNYVAKFSNEDPETVNLASPAIIRWGEVILNRAEAYAHLGETANAISDVNAIRTRAGLPEAAMFSVANMAERGYADVLDVVLDERRMELCFEGFRTLDLQRNKKNIDRRYAGRQDWEVVPYDDGRLVYQIPLSEINTSGIQQNER